MECLGKSNSSRTLDDSCFPSPFRGRADRLERSEARTNESSRSIFDLGFDLEGWWVQNRRGHSGSRNLRATVPLVPIRMGARPLSPLSTARRAASAAGEATPIRENDDLGRANGEALRPAVQGAALRRRAALRSWNSPRAPGLAPEKVVGVDLRGLTTFREYGWSPIG